MFDQLKPKTKTLILKDKKLTKYVHLKTDS